eukprot:763519-Hanusia_phi.AAC.5
MPFTPAPHRVRIIQNRVVGQEVEIWLLFWNLANCFVCSAVKNEGRQEMLAAAAQVIGDELACFRPFAKSYAGAIGKEGCPHLQEPGVGCPEEGDLTCRAHLTDLLT